MVFKPHPKLRQDVIPEGITELQNLRDCWQRKVTPLDTREGPGPQNVLLLRAGGKEWLGDYQCYGC
jgi:hypothetical protein